MEGCRQRWRDIDRDGVMWTEMKDTLREREKEGRKIEINREG